MDDRVETRLVNFDPQSSAGMLVSGWSGYEATETGDTYAWCQARACTLRVKSRADGDRLVRFRCWPLRYPGAPPQTVTLYVSGARVDAIGLIGGARVYSLRAPRAVFRKGVNELRLEFAYADAPKEKVPGSSDQRTLAAAFDWLELVPLPPGETGTPSSQR